MKKIGLFYSYNTKKTSKIAEKIKESFTDAEIDMVNVETITADQFLSYDNIICGVPTWFDGELPNYWDEFIPDLEDLDLTGKTIALFGLGDQKGYPENFLDGVGILGEILESQGARIAGFTLAQGYTFESSKALRGDKFMGLAVDFENQGSMTDERISTWINQLRSEMQ
jgi:flavodoxin I